MPVHSSRDPHEHGGRQPQAAKTVVNRRSQPTSKSRQPSRTVSGTGNVITTRRGSKPLTKSETRTRPETKETEMEDKKSSETPTKTTDDQTNVETSDRNENGGNNANDVDAANGTGNGSEHVNSNQQQLGNTRFSPQNTSDEEEQQQRNKPPTPPPEPEIFTIEKFNNRMDTFTDKFASSKFMNVNEDYPVNDLVQVVSQVTESVEEYKQQTLSSQQHLDELRNRMKDVKQKIQENIQTRSTAIRMSELMI